MDTDSWHVPRSLRLQRRGHIFIDFTKFATSQQTSQLSSFVPYRIGQRQPSIRTSSGKITPALVRLPWGRQRGHSTRWRWAGWHRAACRSRCGRVARRPRSRWRQPRPPQRWPLGPAPAYHARSSEWWLWEAVRTPAPSTDRRRYRHGQPDIRFNKHYRSCPVYFVYNTLVNNSHIRYDQVWHRSRHIYTIPVVLMD